MTGGFIKYLLSSRSSGRRTKDPATKDETTSVSDDEGPRTR